MARKSNIEKIAGLIDIVLEMHDKQNLTNQEIAKELQSQGYEVSTSSVQRAIRKRKLSDKEFKQKLENTKVFVEATKDTPGLQFAKASNDMLMSLVLEELQYMEDLGELSATELVGIVSKLTKAQTNIANVNLKYEEGYKAGLFKAEETLEGMESTGAISEDLAKEIRKAMGLDA